MTEDPEIDRRLDQLGQEFVQRLRRGESPDVEAYAGEHPDLAERIRRLFPVLALVEGVKPPVVTVAPDRPATPAAVGPYRLVRPIGCGGMGRVFQARAPDGARVALKLVHGHLAGRPGFHARFLREIAAGRRVVHESIVKTLDAGVAEVEGANAPYLVLEYVEGQDLHALLEEVGSVSERLAREIGARVAEALEAVHAAGMVHRDVKPENVVIAPDERVKLMDLGVALVQEESLRLTRTGEFVGSLLYASPEQLEGETVDGRSDLYALGLLLHELVTGRHPHAKPGQRRPRVPGRAFAPGVVEPAENVSPFLARVLQRLLALRPADRFQTARELAALLREGEASNWWRERGAGRLPVLAAADAPFTGRGRELAELDRRFASAVADGSRAVLIEGEAGMGKSRLVAAWLDRIGADREGGPPAIVVVHGPDGASDPRALVPAARERAGDGPLVLVAEDIHAASEEERAFYRRATAAGGDADPALWILTARPGVEGSWERIQLSGLDDDDALRLLQSAAGGALPDQADPGEILRNADGNPYCLVEFGRELARSGSGARQGPAIPHSLRELVRGRVDALSDLQRDLLGVASCSGDPFDPVVACDAAGVPRIQGLRAFHDLDRGHHLVRPDGARYRFRHHLVREVLHGELPPALRAAYHSALGAQLEASHAGDDPPDGPRALDHELARHFLLGEDPPRALPYAVSAIQFLHLQGDGRRAVRLADRVLALRDAIGEEHRARVLAARGIVLIGSTSAAEALETLEEAYALSSRLDDPAMLVRVTTSLGLAYRAVGKATRAAELHAEAVALAVRHGDRRQEARARSFLAQSLSELGRLGEAAAMGEHALSLAKETESPELVADVSEILGAIEIERGDLVRARALLETASSVAHLHGDVVTETNALLLLGKIAYVGGDLRDALAILERLVRIHHQEGLRRQEAMSHVNIASVCTRLGEFERADRHARLAHGMAEASGYDDVAVYALDARARCAEARGRLREAVEVARSAHARPAALGQPLLEVRTALSLARLLAQASETDEARVLIDESAAWLQGRDIAREDAGLEATRAELAEARGDDAAALQAWTRAGERARAAGLVHERWVAGLRRGAALLRLGRPEDARPVQEEAREALEKSGAVGYAMLARIWLAALDETDPAKLLVTLNEREPSTPRLLLARALSDLAKARPSRAIEARARAVREGLG